MLLFMVLVFILSSILGQAVLVAALLNQIDMGYPFIGLVVIQIVSVMVAAYLAKQKGVF